MKNQYLALCLSLFVCFLTPLEASRLAGAVVEFWDVVAPRAGCVVRSVRRSPALDILQEEMAVVTMSKRGVASRVSPAWTPKIWIPGVVDAESAVSLRPYNRGRMLRRTPTLLRPDPLEPRMPGLVVARPMSTKAPSPTDEEEHRCADDVDDFSVQPFFQQSANKSLLFRFLNDVLDRQGDEELVDFALDKRVVSCQRKRGEIYVWHLFCKDKKNQPYRVAIEKTRHTQPVTTEQPGLTPLSYEETPALYIVLINKTILACPEHYFRQYCGLDEPLRDLSWVIVKTPPIPHEQPLLQT